MTKADQIRKWYAGKPLPTTTSECAECADATGASIKTVWIVMRHERTPEQRSAYFSALHKRKYESDEGYREGKREAARRQSARRRAAQQAGA